MPKNVIVEGLGKVTLLDNDYLASGGQADIFVKDSIAYKIYHDEAHALPLKKIEELQKIASDKVLTPQHLIYDGKNKPIGYTMEFKKNTFPICKLFTKSFKMNNNISNDMINEFIEKMMETAMEIHKAQCLVVDFNELNVLSSSKYKTPYFIDVDSYQTPSYKATAIMESIRDRTVKDRKWTQDSDWYSFAILAFQLWIGIHPYKGGHPDYSGGDWGKRMDDGVSVFDKKATLPKACNDFSVIPPNFLVWFKDLFVNNKRYSPPSFAEIQGVVIPVSMPTVQQITNAIFETKEVIALSDTIHNVFNFMGINYFNTSGGLFKEKTKLPVDTKDADKVVFCESGDINPVVAVLKDNKISFMSDSGASMGQIMGNDMMYRNGCIYSFFGGQLIENTFTKMGAKVVHMPRHAGNVLNNSTQVFKGVIFQNILGKIHVTLPYEKGKLCVMHIAQLDGHRILDASSIGNICVVMAEKKGVYSRIYLTFNQMYSQYSVRKTDNVPYSAINFALMGNGVGVLGLESEAEIFKDSNARMVANPPFDADSSLYNISGSLYYIDGNKMHFVKMAK